MGIFQLQSLFTSHQSTPIGWGRVGWINGFISVMASLLMLSENCTTKSWNSMLVIWLPELTPRYCSTTGVVHIVLCMSVEIVRYAIVAQLWYFIVTVDFCVDNVLKTRKIREAEEAARRSRITKVFNWPLLFQMICYMFAIQYILMNLEIFIFLMGGEGGRFM